jgi:voltage-gated potassium channel
MSLDQSPGSSEAESAVARWERRGQWPLALAAVVFLAAYAWPILDVRLNPNWRNACRSLDYAVWVIFAADYIALVALATDRRRFVYRHLPDLAIVALPVLRPLRLLRVVMLLKVLNRGATASLRGRVAIYVCGATVLLVFCASLAELDAERNAKGANIATAGDALWWATSTITTVGYGDRYPVTTQGRFVAAGLMLGGIALIGVITAAVATWMIDRVRQVEADLQAPTLRDLQALGDKVDALTALIMANTAQDEHGIVLTRGQDQRSSPDRNLVTAAEWRVDATSDDLHQAAASPHHVQLRPPRANVNQP